MDENERIAYQQRAEIIIDFMKDYKVGELITGVEIGVWQGDLVSFLLDLEPRIDKMYGIDPYSCGTGYWRRARQRHWDNVYNEVFDKMYSNYGSRFELIRSTSESSVNAIPMVDFVEIDGIHSYANVLQDIELYEKKVKSGGMLCGHDYFGRYRRPIRRAVHEYAEKHGREVFSHDVTSGMWWWRVDDENNNE